MCIMCFVCVLNLVETFVFKGMFGVSVQGSNKWYAKVKAEGGKSSVKTMKCNGKSGSRTSDGYFVFNGLNTCSLSCRVQFTRGGSESGRVKAC